MTQRSEIDRPSTQRSHQARPNTQRSREARPLAQRSSEARPMAQRSNEGPPIRQRSKIHRPMTQRSPEPRPMTQRSPHQDATNYEYMHLSEGTDLEKLRLPEKMSNVMRLLGQSSCAFCRFWRLYTFNKCSPRSPRAVDNHAPLLPMGLPYPHAENEIISMPKSRRRCARFWDRRHAQKWTNRLVAYFNFVEMGGEALKSASIIGSRALSHKQQNFVDELQQDVLEWCRLSVQDPLTKSRGKGIKLYELVNVFNSGMYNKNGHFGSGSSQALTVNPDRVALPVSAGGVNPEDWLPTPMREEYLDLRSKRKSPDLWGDLPKSCNKVPPPPRT